MSDPDDRFHEPLLKEGYAVDIYPVRWQPYKPDGQRQMRAKGRWQRMNDYSGWDNCEKPNFVFVEPPTIGSLSWRSPKISPKSSEPGLARRVLVWLTRPTTPHLPGRMTFGHRIVSKEDPPPPHWPKDGWFFDGPAENYEVTAWAYADPPPETTDGR